MKKNKIKTNLKADEVLSRYFIENRSRLLDVAAFLDRLDRAKLSEEPGSKKIEDDFRICAFLKAIAALLPASSEEGSSRVHQIQMIFSDLSSGPLEKIGDSKSAWGAHKNQCC